MLTYITGGLLGDFIHSLYVCKSIFKATGHKAFVLISDKGDRFRFGAQKAFEDVQTLLLSQDYIENCQVYAGQRYDIDLTAWRSSPHLFKATWTHIYNSCFGIDNWGKDAWLIPKSNLATLSDTSDSRDTIFFNSSITRYVAHFPYDKLFTLGKKIVFICFHASEAQAFFEKSGVTMDVCVVKDVEDMATHIVYSYGFIGNLSSPLAICIATNKYCLGILGHVNNPDAVHMKDLEIPNYHYWCDETVHSLAIEDF
jgi:hypothetical protein